MMTARDIDGEICTMRPGEQWRQIGGVDVRRDPNGCWFVQAGGGVTFHRTSAQAAKAIRRLQTHLRQEGVID